VISHPTIRAPEQIAEQCERPEPHNATGGRGSFEQRCRHHNVGLGKEGGLREHHKEEPDAESKPFDEQTGTGDSKPAPSKIEKSAPTAMKAPPMTARTRIRPTPRPMIRSRPKSDN
jgi:hypothetical protein